MSQHPAIPVDLRNPGQVLACLGFLEAADAILGEARGGFDWSAGEQSVFRLSAGDSVNPFRAVLDFLSAATVTSLAPSDSALSTEKWGVPTTVLPERAPYPVAVPDTPATLPVRLDASYAGERFALTIDHWGDRTSRDNVKFWAGAGGYPGAALFRDALDLTRNELAATADNPSSFSKPQSSSFRLDWRRDYIPLDAGFSPNLHTSLVMMGFPIVEMLAVIGLTHARPRRAQRNKLEYRYSVLGIADRHTLYDPILLRAALGGAELPFPHRDFLMRLGWPGQENQARCITNVVETTRG